MASISKLKDMKARTGTQDSGSVNGMVKDIPIGDIQIKGNVRQDYTGIEELAASIRQHGLLQPTTVYKEGDEFLIKTGHRRFKACQQLYQAEPDRFQNIRCIVSKVENIAVIQLVENFQREELTLRELYDAYSVLRQQGYSHKEIADMTGKSI
jgi:ParB family chromosome partitioning protein